MSGRERRRGLEGIRGIGMLMVLSIHVELVLMGDISESLLNRLTIWSQISRHGLTMFFVLSGFLLYLPYAGATMAGRAKPNLRRYVLHRFMRLWPAYVPALLIAGLVFGAAVTEVCEGRSTCTYSTTGRLTDPVLLLTNLLLIQGWFPSTAFTGLGVSWSLVTEFGFYVLLPIVGAIGIWAARRGPSLFAALLPGLLMVAIGMVGKWGTQALWQADGHEGAVHIGPTWYAVVNHSVFGQADLLGFGMLASAMTVAVGQGRLPVLRRWAWTLAWGALAAMIVLVASGSKSDEAATQFVGLGVAAVIVLTQLPGPDRLASVIVSVLDWRPFRTVGDQSYSWYLWHFPILLWLHEHVDAAARGYDTFGAYLVFLVVVTALVAVVGHLSYRFIERPAMEWARSRDFPQKPTAAG